MRYCRRYFLILFLTLGFFSADIRLNAFAQEEYLLTITEHKFSPQELFIARDQKVKIIVENHDATAEEFESYDLRREKVIAGKGRIILYIGPLKAGVYKFFGEFHPLSAVGLFRVQ